MDDYVVEEFDRERGRTRSDPLSAPRARAKFEKRVRDAMRDGYEVRRLQAILDQDGAVLHVEVEQG